MNPLQDILDRIRGPKFLCVMSFTKDDSTGHPIYARSSHWIRGWNRLYEHMEKTRNKMTRYGFTEVTDFHYASVDDFPEVN